MKYSDQNGVLKNISNIRLFKDKTLKSISNIYTFIDGVKVLVWTAIQLSGVFGSGIWMNSESWGNDDLWKNEP